MVQHPYYAPVQWAVVPVQFPYPFVCMDQAGQLVSPVIEDPIAAAAGKTGAHPDFINLVIKGEWDRESSSLACFAKRIKKCLIRKKKEKSRNVQSYILSFFLLLCFHFCFFESTYIVKCNSLWPFGNLCNHLFCSADRHGSEECCFFGLCLSSFFTLLKNCGLSRIKVCYYVPFFEESAVSGIVLWKESWCFDLWVLAARCRPHAWFCALPLAWFRCWAHFFVAKEKQKVNWGCVCDWLGSLLDSWNMVCVCLCARIQFWRTVEKDGSRFCFICCHPQAYKSLTCHFLHIFIFFLFVIVLYDSVSEFGSKNAVVRPEEKRLCIVPLRSKITFWRVFGLTKEGVIFSAVKVLFQTTVSEKRSGWEQESTANCCQDVLHQSNVVTWWALVWFDISCM